MGNLLLHIDDLVVKQLQVQEIIDKRDIDFHSILRMTSIYTAALLGELTEVNDELNYKWWKNYKAVDMAHLREEVADIFIITLDYVIRLAGRDTERLNILLLNYLTTLNSCTGKPNLVDSLGLSEGTVYYTNKMSSVATDLLNSFTEDDFIVDKFDTLFINNFVTHKLHLLKGLFDNWCNLVCGLGIQESIADIILEKQSVNVDRQLGNIKGKEKEYQLSYAD